MRIIDHESPACEIAQASFLDFLLARRAPSDTIQMRRAFSIYGTIAFPPQPAKALIGTSTVGGECCLSAKF